MVIYKTTNKINGKFYVGKDLNNNPDYLGSGKVLKQAIQKYGKQNFKKEIIEVCTDEDVWLEREKFWIRKLNAIEKGYNIAVGGNGGDTISNHPNRDTILNEKSERIKNESTSHKLKKSLQNSKRMKKVWEDWRNDIKKLENRNKKISESQKGKVIPKEVIEKQRKSLIESGKVRGENNPMYGKHHTPESKLKISKAKTGKSIKIKPRAVYRFYKLGNFIGECIGQKEAKEFCLAHKISYQSLCKSSDMWNEWTCKRNRKYE